jgi:hypothetical protein
VGQCFQQFLHILVPQTAKCHVSNWVPGTENTGYCVASADGILMVDVTVKLSSPLSLYGRYRQVGQEEVVALGLILAVWSVRI